MENDIEKRIEKLETYVINHEEDIKNNRIGISSNSQKIESNSGAISVLKVIKLFTIFFFVMWVVTMILLGISVAYNIYLLNDTSTIETTETQEIEQETKDGDNYYVGRDGDINGKAKD